MADYEDPICTVTHSQLIQGKCPHCELVIRQENVESDNCDDWSDIPNRIWNIPHILDVFQSMTRRDKLATLVNLEWMESESSETHLRILSKALQDTERHVHDMSAQLIANLGARIGLEPTRLLIERADKEYSETLKTSLLIGAYWHEWRKLGKDAGRRALKGVMLDLVRQQPWSVHLCGKYFTSVCCSDVETMSAFANAWVTKICPGVHVESTFRNLALFVSFEEAVKHKRYPEKRLPPD